MERVGVLLLAIILSGCASSVHHSSKQIQRDEEFGIQQLLEGDITLLSITAEPGLKGLEQPLQSGVIYQSDSITSGRLKVLGVHESSEKIKQANLEEEYKEATNQYRTPSTISEYFLSKLTDLFKTRYFMLIHLEMIRQNQSYFSGPSPLTSESVKVKAHAKVWNGETGDLVWAGESSIIASRKSFPDVKNMPEQHTRKMAQGIVETLLADYDNFVKDYLKRLN
jgi:hypothetical protein